MEVKGTCSTLSIQIRKLSVYYEITFVNEVNKYHLISVYLKVMIALAISAH